MNNNKKGIIITALGVLLMSFESLFIKLTSISPFTFSFYLGIFMFISMLLLLIIKQRDIIREVTKTSFYIFLLCGILMGSANIFFIWAIKSTTAANVVLIIGTGALFTSFFAYLFYKEKIRINVLIASFFLFIGLFIIFNDKVGAGNLKGNLLAILCTMTFSLSFVLMSKYTRINRVALTAITGISLAIIAYFASDTISIDFYNLFVVGVMGLIITPFSRVLIFSGTKFINASEVSLLMIIETVMGPIWVWMVLNEVPSSYTFIGGAIILLTLIVNSIYFIRKN
ncbi:DMT family transporter [Arcobacter sp. F2176]|uniref:DMT family transporter n=1 Tax=Arcobacter sp. F2176 TaxID=2044511 RepID=UPI00100B03FE|nr:DMT family transporter [Arcobacter sp. F2176]RXJ80844.1 EamA family transporter [Arcobacter sp. F2176]